MNDTEKQSIADLTKVIQEKNTVSVLWIVNQDMMQDGSSLPGIVRTADKALTEKMTCYDIGIAYHINTQLVAEQADHLYARLRDQWCKTVYLYERYQRWQYLSALGFRLLKNYAEDDALFYFDISDYKQAPDWLNNRFWAHPERWSKHSE